MRFLYDLAMRRHERRIRDGAPRFVKRSDGALMVREDDGTEREATVRERLDLLKDDRRREHWPTGPTGSDDAKPSRRPNRPPAD